MRLSSQKGIRRIGRGYAQLFCTASFLIVPLLVAVCFSVPQASLESYVPSLLRARMFSLDSGTAYPGGMNPKTVWVVSHRRSGTHMTIDVISQVIEGPLRIVKAGHILPVRNQLSCDCLTYLAAHGKFIHPYRDVRDVVVATYFYRRRFDEDVKAMNLSLYLLNSKNVLNGVVHSWSRSAASWFAYPGVLSLNFDETVTGYSYVYDKIATFLDQPVKNYGISPDSMDSPSQAVSLFAGKGSAGWRTVMDDETAKRITDMAKAFLREEEKNVLKCPPQRHWDMTGSIRVNNISGLELPASCPKIFDSMPVVMTSAELPN